MDLNLNKNKINLSLLITIYRVLKFQLKITVKVKPNSRENSIKIGENGNYEVKVSVPPEKGKANAKVIELLSKELKIAKSKITLLKGEASREKLFKIEE